MARLSLALVCAALCVAAQPVCASLIISSLTSTEADNGGVVVTAGVEENAEVVTLELQYVALCTTLPTTAASDVAPLRRLAMSPVPELAGGWRATIPVDDPDSGRLRDGSLVRFAVVARDARGAELGRRPSSVDATGERIYRGHVVGYAAIANASNVPPLFWYTDDVERAKGDEATPGSLAFAPVDTSGASAGVLRYYDQVTVHREGSGRHDGDVKQQNAAIKSKDWPKHKFEVSFVNKRFHAWADSPTPKHISLRSMYKESGPVSYMREHLALRLLTDIGVPSQRSAYVRLILNGDFYGLYLLVEKLDSTWLERQRWPAETMLLKAQHWKYSNLRAPDLRLECPQTVPDQQYSPGPGHGRGVGCPMAYQVIVPKPADKWDRSHDALVNSFTMSIEQVANRVFYYGSNDSFVLAFWNQRVDTPQVVTEMAAQALMLNVDRCTKNHVYAHLKAADKWRVVPMDVEDAFATDSRDGYRNCAAEGYACKDSYCYLSCPSFNSGTSSIALHFKQARHIVAVAQLLIYLFLVVLLCDKDHPQDAIDRSTYNHLMSAVLSNPDTKAKYFTRLRQLVERYNNNTRSWLEDQVWALKEHIAVDARADAALWHTTNDFDSAVHALVEQIKQRRKQLYEQVFTQK